jgi:hypothetical protein
MKVDALLAISLILIGVVFTSDGIATTFTQFLEEGFELSFNFVYPIIKALAGIVSIIAGAMKLIPAEKPPPAPPYYRPTYPYR